MNVMPRASQIPIELEFLPKCQELIRPFRWGSIEAARMAVADFGGAVLGRPIEMVSADHQNKADSPRRLSGFFSAPFSIAVPVPVLCGNSL